MTRGRPKLAPSARRRQVQVRLPPDLDDAMRAAAERQRRGLSEYVERAIRIALEYDR